MFTRVPDASKVGLVFLIRQLHVWGFHVMDCQQSSPHVMRLGAEEIPRRDFLDHLTVALVMTERRGRWQFDIPRYKS
jgi:leucyl/phenylalanyl-tRNA--protein transferase